MNDIKGHYCGADNQVRRGSWGMDERGLRILVQGVRGAIEWDRVVSVEVVGPETVNERVTASRLLLIGLFAFGAKKAEGPGVFVTVKLTDGDEFTLQTWRLPAQSIRSWVKQYAPQVLIDDDSATGKPTDLTDQIRKLGELRDSGVLTEDEFASKKAELLARL